MRKRISLLFVALMLALTMVFGSVASAAPDCTGKPSDRKAASCKVSKKGVEPGPPGPGSFVGPK